MKDITIGNQQETNALICGLMIGEGSFLITRVKPRNQKSPSYRACVQFTNTEPELIHLFLKFCKDNNIYYHIKRDNRKGRRICYQISITRHESKIKFIDLLRPYLIGHKKDVAELVYEFVKYMQQRPKGRPTNKKGQFIKTDQSDLEQFWERYKQAKDSSETTCRTPINFG